MIKIKLSSLRMLTKGAIYDLMENVASEGFILFDNNTPITKISDIGNMLGFTEYTWKNLIWKEFKKNNILVKHKTESGYRLFINPLFVPNVKIKITKINFDLFEKSFNKYLKHLEYLKLKSNFYEVNSDIVVKKMKDISKSVSGIYRLYKDNKIVYIGKSVCIRSRLYSHIKEKDIDSFDFTILNNESDKNIYELYYIDKYKPKLNRDCIEKSISNIELEDLVFSDKIKVII